MSDLIDHLAELTQLRDIDVLDTALCALTRDLLQCDRLAIHRLVADGAVKRWLTTGQACKDDPDAPSGPRGGMPEVDQRPEWRDCLNENTARAATYAAHTQLYPMGTNTEAVGVMEVAHNGPLDGNQQRMVGSLLGFYRHLRGLMNENERDSLTGLLNRKTFDETFLRAAMEGDEPVASPDATEAEMEERRAAAAENRYWLAVVDIDHFKRVNDNHGHLIGDEVLLLVAQLMRYTFRYGDRIYRFGGEEFVVLLRCPAAQSARLAFERLRKVIEAHPFPQVGQLTVSIGFTDVGSDDTPSRAFERADRAVYHAKQNGRNRTVAHDELEPPATTNDGPAHCELEFF